MRICFHHRIRSKDGQFVHIEELTNALRRQGHEILFVGPQAIEDEPFGAEAGFIDVLKRKLPGFVYELLEFGYNLRAFLRLLAAIRRERPDCIYERYNLFFPTGIWVKRLTGLPLVLEVNAPLYEERARHSGISLHPFARWSQGVTWRGADYVLPVTNVLADYVRRYGVGEERIVVVPNGIDPARFADSPGRDDAKARLGLSGRTVLGFVGFMHDWHGLSSVVDLLAGEKDPNLHLLLIGDGPARDALERQVAASGLEAQVTFTGTIDRDRVKDYMAAFDIALQPDVTDYASPLKLFEYMYLGQAIAAPDSPNIREILSHDRDALLFTPKDPASLAATLKRLCEDAELRARLSTGARRTIEEKNLTWDHNAETVTALFTPLLQGGNSG